MHIRHSENSTVVKAKQLLLLAPLSFKMQANNTKQSILATPPIQTNAKFTNSTQTCKTLFDQLPFDAVLRICNYACREEVSEHTIAIASINEDMEKAISKCLNGKVDLRHLPHNPVEVFETAIQLCKEVKELYLPKPEIRNPIFLQVLACRTLKKVEMPCRLSYLRALSQGESVESLSLTNSRFHVPDFALLPLLGKLPLKHLEIRCYRPSLSHTYDVDEITQFVVSSTQQFGGLYTKCPSPADISKHCKGIRSFHLNCEFRELVCEELNFASLLENFKRLRRLTISSIKIDHNPEELHALRRLESVSIAGGAYSGSRLARAIQTNVTSFSCALPIPQSQIEGLLNDCPTIKELDIKIFVGGLHHIANYKGQLSSLRLHGRPDSFGPHGIQYAPFNEAELLQISIRHSSLSRLEIYEMKIAYSTIHTILRSLGSSLKVFGCNIDFQNECADTRLLLLMLTCAQYCHNLRELWITDSETFPARRTPIPQVVELPSADRLCFQNVKEKRKQEIWNCLSKLNYRLEDFNTHLLRMQIDYMMYGSINTHEPYGQVSSISKQ